MKVLHRLGFLGFALGTMAFAQPAIPFHTGEWKPYTSSYLPNGGCATELVAAACRAAGITPSFEFFPWLRAEYQVEEGQAFCAFPHVMNSARKARFDFSDPLFLTTPRFIYHDGFRQLREVKASALADLKPYRVALLAGSWTEKDLRNGGIEVNLVNSLEGGVKMVHAGRVDFLVECDGVALAAIRQCFPDEVASFKSLPNIFWGTTANHLLVSRKYPDAAALLATFNRGLRQIKKSGEYRQICSNYKMIEAP